MQIGRRYRIVYKSDTQKLYRSCVMDYLGENDTHYVLNARPVADTQELPKRWVIPEGISEVDKATTGIVIERVIRR